MKLTLVVMALAACKRTPSPAVNHVLGLEPPMAAPASAPVDSTVIDAPADAKGDTGLWPTLLHNGTTDYIAYCDGYLGDVKLALRHDGGAWVTETVDAKGAVGKYLIAALGPNGPELVYLDQDRRVLRYASRKDGAWQLEDIAHTDAREIGIAAKLLIGPGEGRRILHFNNHEHIYDNELLLTERRAGVWSTKAIDKAVGTFQTQIGAGLDADGTLHFTFPNQSPDYPALREGTIAPDGAVKVRGLYGDDRDGTSTQSAIAGDQLFFLRPDGALDYRSLAGGAAQTLARPVRSFRLVKLASGELGVAMVTGAAGVGVGQLELAWKSGDAWHRVVIRDKVSPDFSAAERVNPDGSSVLEFADHDPNRHALDFSEVPLFEARPRAPL